MAMTPGARFGAFEITAKIGAGGMGEVYRARDTSLRRDVAVKVLPDELASDQERVARFELEARTLASLNHAGIAHVYGLEVVPTSDTHEPTRRAIVMELVEGEDLSDRINRGPIGIADLVAIARQIADALGSAHDAGIVHRDLKPSNVRIRPDGVVKVLDFGLAKPRVSNPNASSAALTVTGITAATGAVLGTPSYMSPEQARGQATDMRSDIWAFGCIVYEMLTGRRAFSGATTSDTIAKILEREPEWDALPPSTPPGLRRLVTRCLVKDPKRRLHALADAQFDLDEAVGPDAVAATVGQPAAATRRRWPMVLALVVAAGAATALWWSADRPAATPNAQVLPLTSYLGIEATPTFSPDGKQVAFSWDGDRLDNEDIYVTLVGGDSPHRLTTDAARDVSPVWNPKGSQIAFARLDDTRTNIYVVAAPFGGSEQRLAEFPPARVHTVARGVADPFLSWSPDGQWLIVSQLPAGERSAIYLVAHDGSDRRTVLPGSPTTDYTAAAFSPQGNALAYVDSGFLSIVEIDPRNPSNITKAPRRLTEYQGYVGGLAWTPDGKRILYGRAAFVAPPPSYLWSIAADGSSAPQRIDLAGIAGFPAVSASGRVAFSRRDLNVDTWLLEEGRDREAVAASTSNEFDASFSPDGSKIAFASDRTGEGMQIWILNRDGSGRRPLTRGQRKPEGSPRWSPDGKRMVFDALGDNGQRQLFIVDDAGGEIRPVQAKQGSFDRIPSWSRDGLSLYFSSDRSGSEEIWQVKVQSGDPQQITTDGGGAPIESWDGRTLFYSKPIQGGRALFSRPVGGGQERELRVNVEFWNYCVGEKGLYYTTRRAGRRSPYTYEVRLLDGSGRSTLLHELRLATINPGMSATPDGNSILVAGVAEIRQDLFLIEHFR